MVDKVRFKHPQEGYMTGNSKGEIFYERWLPSPLIDTWHEAGKMGAKHCASAFELSLQLPWLATNCPLLVGYVGKSPSQSAKIAKQAKQCLWTGESRMAFETRLGVKREIVKIDWVGAPDPKWTSHKGSALGFNSAEAEVFEAEAKTIAALLKIMPEALKEAKALGYAMGIECEPGLLSRNVRDLTIMVQEPFRDTTDSARRKGYMLYVDKGGKKGFVRPMRSSQYRTVLAPTTASAQIFDDPQLAMKYASSKCYGAKTIKLVEVEIVISAYETLEGYKAPIDELEAAVRLRECEELLDEVEVARVARLDRAEREVLPAPRRLANRL